MWAIPLRDCNPGFKLIYARPFLLSPADGNKHNELIAAPGHWSIGPLSLGQSGDDLVTLALHWSQVGWGRRAYSAPGDVRCSEECSVIGPKIEGNRA